MKRQGWTFRVVIFVFVASATVSILMCLALAIFARPVLIAAGIQDLFSNEPRDSWKTITSPLLPDQIMVLCRNFNLSKEVVCNKKDVYGPEFYPYIIDAFHPSEFAKSWDTTPPATYDEVEKKLGQFKTTCYPGVTGSSTFQLLICDYDLRGDGAYTLGIYFEEPERTVFRIVGPLNDDW